MREGKRTRACTLETDREANGARLELCEGDEKGRKSMRHVSGMESTEEDAALEERERNRS